MFELEHKTAFFEFMATEYPEIVQNIEILNENKILLDISYHKPKDFILNLNNSLRALLYFIESSLKNSPDWIRHFVQGYRDANLHNYEVLKYLRDVSAHHALVFPKESIIVGLYRIHSRRKYVLKIGMGDIEGPREYPRDTALMNSDDIFHDMLVFHSMIFMDMDHACLGECLGLTRRWFFHVKFKK